jgi:hypothetical protein
VAQLPQSPPLGVVGEPVVSGAAVVSWPVVLLSDDTGWLVVIGVSENGKPKALKTVWKLAARLSASWTWPAGQSIAGQPLLTIPLNLLMKDLSLMLPALVKSINSCM